jgi:cyclomaltodextrinase
MRVDTVPAWVREAVFYQIFPDRFASSRRVHKPGPLEAWDAPPTVTGFKGGDLLGIAEHLDYLVDLGVNGIYLNPIFASASNHRYHTYDYLNVDPLLGGNDALRELLDEAHAHGIRVVLDGVFNHAGRGFWPFHHVMENGIGSPYRDWFHFNHDWLREGRQILAYPDAGQGVPDPDWAKDHAAGEQSLHDLGYRAWWDLPALPKLNVDNPEVREYLLHVAEHWIRFGADGWRLDVPAEIPDPEFWAQFRRRVRAANPDAYIVGEIWSLAPDWIGPQAFDALMNYPLGWRILGFAAGSHLDLAVAAEHGFIRSALRPLDAPTFAAQVADVLAACPPENVSAQLNMVDSHDTPRAVTMCGGDETSLRLCLLLLLSMPGIPLIYYGDEVGMSGHHDPDCRGAFPWDPVSWNASLHHFVKSGIAARRRVPSLMSDELRELAADGMAVALLRGTGGEAALVLVNSGEAPARLHLPVLPAADPQPVLTVGPAPRLEAQGEGFDVYLEARSGAVMVPHL